MAIIEIVNVSTPNDGLGDTLRNSQVKANDNFAELNAKKVEVVAGKDLSDNNFTDTEKDKLAAIAEDAEKNVQSNWNQTDNTADDYILNKPTSSKYLIQNGYSLVDNVLTIFAGWIWVINDNQYTNLVDIEITYPYAAVGYSRLDRVVFTTLSTAVRIAGDESTDTPLAPPIPDSTLEFGISLITEDSSSSPIPPDPTDQNNIPKTIETTLSAIGSTDWADDVQINLAQYLSDETIVVSETQIYRFKITNTDGTYQIYEQLNQGKGLIPNDPSKLFLLVDRSILKQNTLTAGTNITIDNTDPLNPVISSSGGSTIKEELITITLTDIGATDFDDPLLKDKLLTYMQSNLPDTENNKVYSYELTDEVPFTGNFWLESSDWASGAGVTDEASFISFLEAQGATSVVVTNFSLVNNGALKCNVTCDDLTELYLTNLSITEVFALGEICSSLTYLDLNSNQIVNFNPTIALPSGLIELDLSTNQIVTFNPTISLPSGLTYLDLSSNQIVNFNPTIALPSGLTPLDLSSNQITTASWNTNTAWISSLPTGGIRKIYTNGNVNSIAGTNSETLLIAKGWTIYP